MWWVQTHEYLSVCAVSNGSADGPPSVHSRWISADPESVHFPAHTGTTTSSVSPGRHRDGVRTRQARLWIGSYILCLLSGYGVFIEELIRAYSLFLEFYIYFWFLSIYKCNSVFLNPSFYCTFLWGTISILFCRTGHFVCSLQVVFPVYSLVRSWTASNLPMVLRFFFWVTLIGTLFVIEGNLCFIASFYLHFYYSILLGLSLWRFIGLICFWCGVVVVVEFQWN